MPKEEEGASDAAMLPRSLMEEGVEDSDKGSAEPAAVLPKLEPGWLRNSIRFVRLGTEAVIESMKAPVGMLRRLSCTNLAVVRVVFNLGVKM